MDEDVKLTSITYEEFQQIRQRVRAEILKQQGLQDPTSPKRTRCPQCGRRYLFKHLLKDSGIAVVQLPPRYHREKSPRDRQSADRAR